MNDAAKRPHWIHYIDPKGLAALRRWFDQFWEEPFEAFRAETEKPQPNEELK